jgi:hypothetical protein
MTSGTSSLLGRLGARGSDETSDTHVGFNSQFVVCQSISHGAPIDPNIGLVCRMATIRVSSIDCGMSPPLPTHRTFNYAAYGRIEWLPFRA